jgi:iron complex transport system permease protein
MTNKKNLLIFGILGMLLLLLFFISLINGTVNIPAKEVFQILFNNLSDNPTWQSIVNEFRLPKALTAILAGTALSVSGLQMQTLFRNPLAGPFILGVSSGAALGVSLLIFGTGLFSITGLLSTSSYAITLAGCIGASMVLLVMFLVSLKVQNMMTVLILGIMLSSMINAIVSFLQYFSSNAELKSYTIWTMGSLGAVDNSQLPLLSIIILIGILIGFLFSYPLNILLLGEKYASSMGVNIKVTRIFTMLSTALLAGSVTAFCGPLAFIGMAIPHVARKIINTSDHRLLIPACILTGSIMMLLCDILASLSFYDQTLPINSVTSFIGAPIVIWVVLRPFKFFSLRCRAAKKHNE